MNRQREKRRSGAQVLRQLVGWAAFFGILFSLGLTALFVPAEIAEESWPAPGLDRRLSARIEAAIAPTVEGYVHVNKHYVIPEGRLPGVPEEQYFGQSSDPLEIQAVIERAGELLGGETVTGWTTETVLRPDTGVQYYYDETILALVWQELSQWRICTWCEVKLADPSQLRRKLSGDRYGYSIRLPASQLAVQDNAVAAVSGDFYAFRQAGIHVYDGELYLVSGDNADTCFFDRDGDMHIVHRNEITTWEEAEAYIRENDIDFSVAFGPSVLENGVINVPYNYRWGENYNTYARAVLSQVGQLHYLFLCANCRAEGYDRFTMEEAAELMVSHGCTMAYALDGGQTAEVIFRGQTVNRPEFNFERQVSDVICFASALPAKKGGSE